MNLSWILSNTTLVSKPWCLSRGWWNVGHCQGTARCGYSGTLDLIILLNTIKSNQDNLCLWSPKSQISLYNLYNIQPPPSLDSEHDAIMCREGAPGRFKAMDGEWSRVSPSKDPTWSLQDDFYLLSGIFLAWFQTSEWLSTSQIFFSDSNKSTVVLVDGCFPGWKDNEDNQSSLGGIKNRDVIFLWQSQNNGNRKIASKKATSMTEIDAAVEVFVNQLKAWMWFCKLECSECVRWSFRNICVAVFCCLLFGVWVKCLCVFSFQTCLLTGVGLTNQLCCCYVVKVCNITPVSAKICNSYVHLP